jgi:hypothetical protein
MSLVHYGFSREEVMWMPVTEAQDYILLINQQIERENGEIESPEHQQTDTPTVNDVFKGSFKPHI